MLVLTFSFLISTTMATTDAFNLRDQRSRFFKVTVKGAGINIYVITCLNDM